LQASVIGTSIEVINDGMMMLSINVLWIILGATGLVFVVLLTLKLTKQINYDSFTFVLTILFSFVTFIFVDLIPHWDNEIVRTIAIIAILVTVMTAYYFLFNTIFNSIIIRSHSAYAIKNEYEMDEQEVVESTEKIKNSTKQSGEEFVEV
jgi:predicted membrane protein